MRYSSKTRLLFLIYGLAQYIGNGRYQWHGTVMADPPHIRAAHNRFRHDAFVERLTRSYYPRDVGAFMELQRRFALEYDSVRREWAYELSQVMALYNTDSTKRRWRNRDRDFPITFERRIWGGYDFFHFVANPGHTDKTRHSGDGPLSLCLQNLMLMILIGSTAAWIRVVSMCSYC